MQEVNKLLRGANARTTDRWSRLHEQGFLVQCSFTDQVRETIALPGGGCGRRTRGFGRAFRSPVVATS